MKVSGYGSEDVWAYLHGLVGRESREAGTEAAEPQGLTPDQDRVALSSQARTVHEIRQVVEETPDVRENRVTEIKAAIEQGTYNIRGEQVADSMLRQQLIDTVL